MNKRYITTKELSLHLGLHTETIRRMCRDGRIPYIKVSKTDFKFDLEKVIKRLEKDAENGNGI